MALFTACKKEPIKPIVTVPPDPYKHSRLVEASSDDGTLYKYSYNTANQLSKVEYFKKPGVVYSTQTYSYLNGKLVQMVSESANSMKYVTDYKYQGNTDLIESTTFTATNYQNTAQPVVTSKFNQEYNYLNGNVIKSVLKDDQNTVFSIRTFNYSLNGTNPVVTTDNVPQAVNGAPATPAYSGSNEYYNNVLDPTSYFLNYSISESKFLLKNATSSQNKNSFIQTYDLDDMGRIKTVLAATLNNSITQSVVKTTYTYESY